jgi:hypothetical protein
LMPRAVEHRFARRVDGFFADIAHYHVVVQERWAMPPP